MHQLAFKTIAGGVIDLPEPVSLKHDLLTIDMPGGASVRPRMSLLHSVLAFAPELRLHPDDAYLPSSVPWYLRRVHMRFHRAGAGDSQVLNKGQVTVQSLIRQKMDGQWSAGAGRRDFFLQIPNDNKEVEAVTRRGHLPSARCYVHLRKASGQSRGFDIQYWFFYPYSGNVSDIGDTTQGLLGNIAHEGDWEHITVRTNARGDEIHKIFYSEHGHSHGFLPGSQTPSGFRVTDTGHPIVYSAKHSHACYPHANSVHKLLSDDLLSDDGPHWKTWEHLVLIGTKNRPQPGQEWIQYSGHWGELGGFGGSIEGTSGPYGPAFQDSWTSDESTS